MGVATVDVGLEAGAQPVSFGKRVSDLADANPDGAAFVFVAVDGTETEVSWRRLDVESNRAAHILAERGLREGSMLAVCLPNSVEHVVATIAAWKLGACVLPLRANLPEWERDRVLEVARPTLAITAWQTAICPTVRPGDILRTDVSSERLPDRVARPFRAIASSGSTGTPKIIVLREPGEALPATGNADASAFTGQRAGHVQLIPAPMYHTNGFLIAHSALFQGQSIILMERFDAALAVDLVERHRVNIMTGVTIMLQRIARLPDIDSRDLSSLLSVIHGGAPLPHWLAEWWINKVGAEQFTVCYGSSENAGAFAAKGSEWLVHRGTVGHPFNNTEVAILDDEGDPVPAGTIGTIWMRRYEQTERIYDYRGDVEAETRPDFFSSIGDLGWVDDDGYLYLADRRKDMIISGGSNVYPAEVEAALTEHPAVSDVVVVGLPDPEWGQHVHAIVQLATGLASPPDAGELREHCRARLAAYKVPKSYEIVDAIPRTSAGKIRRSQLADDRTASKPVAK